MNAVAFAAPILKGEVNVADQLLLEAIRAFIPKLYVAIRDNGDLLLNPVRDHMADRRPDIKGLVDAALSSLRLAQSHAEPLRNRLIEHLFPRAGNSIYGNDWLETWAQEKRLCSKEYFWRYFTYGVPSGDVADSTIERTVQTAVAEDVNRLTEIWHTIELSRSFPKFIQKLRFIEKTVPQHAASSLVAMIANGSPRLPREPGSFLSDNTIRQAAILSSHLAERIPNSADRFQVLMSAMTSCSFVFAVECIRWTRANVEEGTKYGFLSEEDTRSLTMTVMDRLVREANGQALYRVLGDDTTTVLLPWAWFGDIDKMHNILAETVRREGADGAEALLQKLCGKGWAIETGVPHRSAFSDNSYKTLEKLIDPEIVDDALRERYGSEMDVSTYDRRDNPSGLRLAQQFSFVRKQQVAGNSANEDED